MNVDHWLPTSTQKTLRSLTLLPHLFVSVSFYFKACLAFFPPSSAFHILENKNTLNTCFRTRFAWLQTRWETQLSGVTWSCTQNSDRKDKTVDSGTHSGVLRSRSAHLPFTVPHTERTSQQAAFVSWPQRTLVNSESLLKEKTLNKLTRLYQHQEEVTILWCGDTVAMWFAPFANTTYCTGRKRLLVRRKARFHRYISAGQTGSWTSLG